jgi:hypothetical protein
MIFLVEQNYFLEAENKNFVADYNDGQMYKVESWGFSANWQVWIKATKTKENAYDGVEWNEEIPYCLVST